jgi:hypothetical protein
VSWGKGAFVRKVGVIGLMLFRFACSMDRKMEPRLGSRRCRSGQLRWGRWRGIGQVRYRRYSTASWKAPVFSGQNVFENRKGGLDNNQFAFLWLKLQPPGHLTKESAHVAVDVIQAALSGWCSVHSTDWIGSG